MQSKLTESQKRNHILNVHTDYEDLALWDSTVANELAKSENIQLTPEHMEVVGYLRQTYKKHGQIRRAHSLTQALNTRFASKGGLKYLYTLFPGGPISQGCKLAGISAPSDSKNDSFGTLS